VSGRRRDHQSHVAAAGSGSIQVSTNYDVLAGQGPGERVAATSRDRRTPRTGRDSGGRHQFDGPRAGSREQATPSPAGTQRRIQALMNRSWDPEVIERETGAPAREIAHAFADRRSVRPELARHVAAVCNVLRYESHRARIRRAGKPLKLRAGTRYGAAGLPRCPTTMIASASLTQAPNRDGNEAARLPCGPPTWPRTPRSCGRSAASVTPWCPRSPCSWARRGTRWRRRRSVLPATANSLRLDRGTNDPAAEEPLNRAGHRTLARAVAGRGRTALVLGYPSVNEHCALRGRDGTSER